MSLKNLIKKNWINEILAASISAYLRLVRWTSKFEEVNVHHFEDVWAARQDLIIAFWHGRLPMIIYAKRPGMAIHVLISRSRDGEVISRVMSRFGIRSIRGSSHDQRKRKDKGGAAALREMVGNLQRGEQVALTPDGPKGPRMRVSEGTITLARLSGKPIIPLGTATSRRWLFNSWDRFQLPLPFSKTVFVYGPPFSVARDCDDPEAARLALETLMITLNQQADRAVGQNIVEPAGAAR
jgi:lysophospholipid acyltransferase (LPLAT)-like uncharacterized protein